MRFLITDLGIEDVILGYPWLSTFEPQFSWKDVVLPQLGYKPLSQPNRAVLSQAKLVYRLMTKFGLAWLVSWA